MKEAKDFYNEFAPKLLADYAHGNPRTEAAIRYAVSKIPASARRILDLGCGIGWSSGEIKRALPAAAVLGVDLSPQLIETAAALFATPDLAFAAADLTQAGLDLAPPFDAIVMLDVYEHIPREARGRLHQQLARLLGPEGILLLTFPSVSHQEFLKQCHPDQIQPVDELIHEPDLQQLARDRGGRLFRGRRGGLRFGGLGFGDRLGRRLLQKLRGSLGGRLLR